MDIKIHNLASSDEKLSLEYFVKNQFPKIEVAFLEAYDFVNSQIDTYISLQPEHNSAVSRDHSIQHNINIAKLPKISILSFLRNYTDWEYFRDSLEALIVYNSLSSVVQVQYLKISFTGEAENFIKSVKIIEANF